MEAKKHPSYVHEKSQLAATLKALQAYIEKNTPVVGLAADQRTAHIVYEVKDELLQRAKDAQKYAYFGRVDWCPANRNERERFYVGSVSFGPFDDIQIFSWADTMVGDLYYSYRTDRENGTLFLVRNFEIDKDHLNSISDQYLEPKMADQVLAEGFADSMLLRLMEQARTGQLKSIVATIRDHQYQIIRAPEDQLLIVHGVPGSGKTEVALHRIAYLLYRDRKKAGRREKNVLILGPNELFMEYVSRVLPALGERHIPQKSFDHWLRERLDFPLEYLAPHLSLELLLDQKASIAERAQHFRNAHNKSSLRMAELLDRYVAHLQDEVLKDDQPLVCRVTNTTGHIIEITRTIEAVRMNLNTLASVPLNERRQKLEERLTEEITRDALAKLYPGPRVISDSGRRAVYNAIAPQIRNYFEHWRSINITAAYRKLFRTSTLLHQLGNGLFSKMDLELLHRDVPTVQEPFRHVDLAPLLYLKHLLVGPGSQRYDHIVIDEAQDLSPLQFKVLQSYSTTGSMTILGDLHQAIYVHHGLGSWDAFQHAAGNKKVQVETLKTSYRSTEAIIDFANKLLKRIGVTENELIIPFSRSGSPPTLHKLADRSELPRTLVSFVERERQNGRTSIAIVCKTAASCRTLADSLTEEQRNTYQLLDDADAAYQGGIAIIPAYLTKGIEFDSVIVADADSDTYSTDELHARLLYTTITRASHTLYICWAGTLTPLLSPDRRALTLAPSLPAAVMSELVTIQDWAISNQLDPDWCVERLAGANKLGMLQQGKIEGLLLELLLQPYLHNQRRLVSDTAVQNLSDREKKDLKQHVSMLDAIGDPNLQTGLGLTQLVYGLMRNQLRAAGIAPDDELEQQLSEQVIALATFLQAIEVENGPLTAGRWTTRRRSLDQVAKHREKQAESIIDTLIEMGALDLSDRAMRVSQEWIPELLRLALGEPPENFGWDLLSLLSCPPSLLNGKQLRKELTNG
jgi:DNA helicase II / ATP-dependent DNA helicase PcrA